MSRAYKQYNIFTFVYLLVTYWFGYSDLWSQSLLERSYRFSLEATYLFPPTYLRLNQTPPLTFSQNIRLKKLPPFGLKGRIELKLDKVTNKRLLSSLVRIYAGYENFPMLLDTVRKSNYPPFYFLGRQGLSWQAYQVGMGWSMLLILTSNLELQAGLDAGFAIIQEGRYNLESGRNTYISILAQSSQYMIAYNWMPQLSLHLNRFGLHCLYEQFIFNNTEEKLFKTKVRLNNLKMSFSFLLLKK